MLEEYSAPIEKKEYEKMTTSTQREKKVSKEKRLLQVSVLSVSIVTGGW